MTRNVKLVGFALLLAVMFAGAHVAGAALGPLTAGHSHVSYTGTDSTGGMNMGGP
ncbi:MAG TPA: hypothetical protein VFB06_03505 [Streptosporangiaceae bacterium]|nr:hypothetical protein [Streptosporangiaceae bacterium]